MSESVGRKGYDNMKNKVLSIREDFDAKLKNSLSTADVEQIRIEFLGKK